VSWTNLVRVTATGNTIQKWSGAGNRWNAGASSTNTIYSGDGYVQVTVNSLSAKRIFGLGNGDSSVDRSDIEFGIEVDGGTLQVYESGRYINTFGNAAVNDVLRVAVEGGVVRYYRNGTPFYTSTITPSYPLVLDASIYTAGGQVSNATICRRNPSP
jgi:hypothetical protein